MHGITLAVVCTFLLPLHVIYSVPKLIADNSHADDTAQFIVKSVYNAMCTHIEEMPIQVRVTFSKYYRDG